MINKKIKLVIIFFVLIVGLCSFFMSDVLGALWLFSGILAITFSSASLVYRNEGFIGWFYLFKGLKSALKNLSPKEEIIFNIGVVLSLSSLISLMVKLGLENHVL